MPNYFLPLLILSSLWIASCQKRQDVKNPTVEVRQEKGKYSLYRLGEPYIIKGAAGPDHLDKIASYGGNSIRTWNTLEADKILDEAASYGLTVTLGLGIGKEYWGKEFNYWDLNAVDQKIADLAKIVEKYKDHPALLMWGVGNEVHIFGGNKFIVFYTINKIAKMIKEIDPNHPVMTTVPLGEHFDERGLIRLLCPNVDILGVNGFRRVPFLYNEIRSTFGWNGAYILSELGAVGPWDGPTTRWGAPLEPNSSEKANIIDYHYSIIQKDTSMSLGSYAFYWGSKYERTHTFMSLFPEPGYETESVKVIESKWTGNKYEDNKAPRIDSLVLNIKPSQDNYFLVADSMYQATIFTQDVDQDSLVYKWEIRQEGKDDFTPGYFNENLHHLLEEAHCSKIRFQAPQHEGGYRLFVFVFDEKHVATHNIPFYVIMK